VGDSVIPEPQRTYVLELLQALGPIADDFVVAGAQAMKFMLRQARATKDIDFVLDAVSLRGQKESVAQTLQKLGYSVVPGSQNFQFQKAIPGSKEVMRIEFMAPEELNPTFAVADVFRLFCSDFCCQAVCFHCRSLKKR
jgi:hypothetical protein